VPGKRRGAELHTLVTDNASFDDHATGIGRQPRFEAGNPAAAMTSSAPAARRSPGGMPGLRGSPAHLCGKALRPTPGAAPRIAASSRPDPDVIVANGHDSLMIDAATPELTEIRG